MLACTHYPLLLDRLAQLAPWPVAFIDPAPAIARRVVDLSGPKASVEADVEAPAPAQIVFTSGRPPSATLEAALSALRDRRLEASVGAKKDSAPTAEAVFRFQRRKAL